MKKIVILGAGCGGTMMANKLRRDLEPDEWSITIIDKDNNIDNFELKDKMLVAKDIINKLAQIV